MKALLIVIIFATTFISCTKKETSESETSEESVSTSSASGPPVAISGAITFTGQAKKRKALKMTADPVCKKQNAGKKVLSESMIVGPGGSLQNAIVYLKGKYNASKGSTLPAVDLDQQGCRYIPHVLGVQTKQKIRIINSDPTLHNVNAMAKENRSFNIGMATKGQVVEKSFSKPEIVKFKCDVHGWMSTYVGVFDHPYFATTDSSGKFSIQNIPSGKHTLVVWHEKLGSKEQEVEISAEKNEFSVSFP